jgi:hypothetical protein
MLSPLLESATASSRRLGCGGGAALSSRRDGAAADPHLIDS